MLFEKVALDDEGLEMTAREDKSDFKELQEAVLLSEALCGSRVRDRRMRRC